MKRVTCFACNRRLGLRSLLSTVSKVPVFDLVCSLPVLWAHRARVSTERSGADTTRQGGGALGERARGATSKPKGGAQRVVTQREKDGSKCSYSFDFQSRPILT